MSRSDTSPRFIDLFSGAGGLGHGFMDEGFVPLFANDHEVPALNTYAANHPGVPVTSDDIESIDASELRERLGLAVGGLDAIIGGPPCQGFSTYGQRNPEDLRNQLYRHYLRFVEEFRPKTFVIENVVGILSMMDGFIVDDIVTTAEELGYETHVHVLQAEDYGVPQKRRRVFILGAHEGRRLHKPVATHGLDSPQGKQQALDFEGGPGLDLPRHLTVGDAISDLASMPALSPRETHKESCYLSDAETTYQKNMRRSLQSVTSHSAKQMMAVRRLRLALLQPGDYGTQLRYRLGSGGLPPEVIEELLSGSHSGMADTESARLVDRKKDAEIRQLLGSGAVDVDALLEQIDAGGFANKYRRLHWDEPSHTLVAHMARDCSDFVHPTLDRFITVREAARLQSFPDDFVFTGSQFQQLRQIGNAVPPALGAAVARAVRQGLS